MNACSNRERIQDLLDGLVTEPEASALRRHLADCAECAIERALFERVFVSLERLPLEAPSPGLADRVLARVLPSRRRRHRVAVIGWGYAGCVAVFAGILGALAVNSPARAVVEQSVGAVSHRVVETMSFGLHFAGVTVLALAGGLDAMATTGERLAPIGRALHAVLTTPSLVAALLTAFAACAALLWWLCPVAANRRRMGPTDVGIIGFWGMA